MSDNSPIHPRVRVRFAPSPTGPLHLGGVRTALYNYLFAKKHGGDFLLRIEDTDQTRYVAGAEQYILDSLKWAGMSWAEGPDIGGSNAPYRQSERKHLYKQYADQLIANEFAYYAFDTTEDLEDMRNKAEAGGATNWKYDYITRDYMKNSLTLSEDEVNERLQNEEAYVIRLKTPRNEEIKLHDIIRGYVSVQSKEIDDKVLYKSDGMPTYHLANVVDDHLMEISHVIRGDEWLPSAPLHVLLYRYLGWEDTMPEFAHLPLILKPDGNGKLSKRDGDRLGFPVFALDWIDPTSGEKSSGYRENGYLPEAFINIIALLGWHPADNKELLSMEELVELFSLERVSKAGAKFDPEKAKWFNQQYLHHLPDADIISMLNVQVKEAGIQASNEYISQVAMLTRDKAHFTQDMLGNSRYFFDTPTNYDQNILAKRYNEAAIAFCKVLADVWSKKPFESAEEAKATFEKTATDRDEKPGNYMQLLRVLITGEAGGPDLWHILYLMGTKTCVDRIQIALKVLG